MTSSLIHETESSTDPGVKPSAQTIRLDRAATLVLIARTALDHNLAVPQGIKFRLYQETNICLDLGFETAEQAEAWTAHFGGQSRDRVYQPDWREGPIRSHNGHLWDALGYFEVNFDGWTAVSATETAVSVTA